MNSRLVRLSLSNVLRMMVCTVIHVAGVFLDGVLVVMKVCFVVLHIYEKTVGVCILRG